MKSFASDNYASVHPHIMQAILDANKEHASSYGKDEHTVHAIKLLRNLLGPCDAFFVYNGTGANVLGLKAVTHPHQAIICAETAHIHCDECGAPENFTGCKLMTISTPDGKITSEQIIPLLSNIHDVHRAQPKVISITQSTEYGTLYTKDEIKALAKLAHKNNMYLHMDGARIANAAVALKTSIKSITADAGVDVLSFGGSKNGLMFGEAVIFFDRKLAKDFEYTRKQGMQLASKMRYISAQFIAYLTDNLWLNNAQHANLMAQRLTQELRKNPLVKITQDVQTNMVFAIVSKKYIPLLQKESFFYVWNEQTSEVRFVCSFDTTEDDVARFAQAVERIVK